MPKRKSDRNCEQELEHLMHKIRKLEQKIRDKEKADNTPPPQPPAPPPPSPPPCSQPSAAARAPSVDITHCGAVTPMLDPNDWWPMAETEGSELMDGISHAPPLNSEEENVEVSPNVETSQEERYSHTPQSGSSTTQPCMVPQSATAASLPGVPAPDEASGEATERDIELDKDVLNILGEDPGLAEKHGKDIRKELASRFGHTVTEGLSKELRKELTSKYPTPANCLYIGAPKMNPEIKVAVLDNIVKRDRGIETRQKQMASAISCLGEVITTELNSSNTNKETLQKLMDLGRLLCDIQHGDSVTRRNFILFTLKKDLKDHLHNTKIDSLLFGETLADTLKTAKSINRSGIELKADSKPNKNTGKRSKPQTHKPLNRKAPGPAYRQQGPPSRSYQPAVYRTQPPYLPPPPPPPPPAAHSSRASPRQQPPAPPQARRRY